MITLTNQTVYKCEFCKKKFSRKWNAEYHEKNCGLNPKNRHICLTGCEHLIVGEETYEASFCDHKVQRTRKTFTCPFHKGESMYSYVIEKLGFSDDFDMRMPIECEHYMHDLS